MKTYAAIDVRTDSSDLLLAIVDDFGPTAIEERDAIVRVFFSTPADRDAAQHALAPRFDVTSVDVDDEDWARRSQENLKPITVGRITVAPPWAVDALSPEPSALLIVIVPSMGFGTGHHVTTRLCLAALQTIDLTGRVMLDVGTGSGVLAIAADRLGAARAIGIDDDADAIQSARESLELNPDARHVTFETIDLSARALPLADVVTANLTGALLVRSAPALLAAVQPGGTLILSGIQPHERDEVRHAFAAAVVCWEREEDGWVGLAVKKS
ncbi:MAG TPA: 50S ribosomal protein L11 methyltransferase [Vicinamibacterales bacterium]|nr:50S ribosomal protein L11 methyltransferase [Vicinamibacterales bacterium]